MSGDVYRQFSLPVDVFDHLKDTQRAYRARHGVQLTNNEVLAMVLREHRDLTAVRGGRDDERAG